MVKIMYSKKRDEFLVLENNQMVDFADQSWDPSNRFFKAIFGRCVTVAKIKANKKSNKKAKGVELG